MADGVLVGDDGVSVGDDGVIVEEAETPCCCGDAVGNCDCKVGDCCFSSVSKLVGTWTATVRFYQEVSSGGVCATSVQHTLVASGTMEMAPRGSSNTPWDLTECAIWTVTSAIGTQAATSATYDGTPFDPSAVSVSFSLRYVGQDCLPVTDPTKPWRFVAAGIHFPDAPNSYGVADWATNATAAVDTTGQGNICKPTDCISSAGTVTSARCNSFPNAGLSPQSSSMDFTWDVTLSNSNCCRSGTSCVNTGTPQADGTCNPLP